MAAWMSTSVLNAQGAANCVQTMPGKGWLTIFRPYSPLKPWFDQSRKPNDIEKID